MGRKNKRNARARRRHAQKARQAADPTGHIATMEKAMMESGEMGTHDISVLKELNKSSSTSRAVACSAIAHIVLNTPSFITALVRANGIKRLIELLHDMQDINVRTSAAGALRNISIQCSTKSSSSATDRSHVLKQMLDLDIASALVGLLSCESALFKNASGRHQVALLTQTFALLSLLCEYHHTSIVAVFSSQESAIQTAFRYLSVQPSTTTQTHSHAGDDGCTPSCAPTPASGLDFTLYHALSMEVLNFLSLTTEEDSVAIMALLNANGNEKISQLMMLTQPTMTINNSNNNSGASVTLTPRARVASCGILINVIPVLFAQVQSTSTSSSLSFSADDVVGLATSVLSTLSQALATHPTESGVVRRQTEKSSITRNDACIFLLKSTTRFSLKKAQI